MPAMPMERPSTLIDPNRKLSQGDQLSFKIEQDDEPAIPLIVSHTGEVVVEPLERAVRVAGMTAKQAEGEIKRLLEKDYYHTATVRLLVDKVNVTANMGYVYLSGAVNRVGAIPVYQERPMRLSEAIYTAGGFSKFADTRKVKVTRRSKSGGAETFIRDLKRVMQEGDLNQDMLLQDGDQIFVKETYVKWN